MPSLTTDTHPLSWADAQEVRPGFDSLTADGLDSLLTELETLGAKLTTIPEIEGFRTIHRRARDLALHAATLRGQSVEFLVREAALRYAAGTGGTTPDALADAAASATVKTDPGGQFGLQSVLANAVRLVDTCALDAVRAVQDRWITKLLRPIVTAKLRQIEQHVRATGITAATEPTGRTMIRAAEDLDQLLSELSALHTFSDAFVRLGLVPAPKLGPSGQSWISADFRWLRHDRLDGNPTHRRRFFLSGLERGGEPGCWTAAEVMAANPPKRPEVAT